MNSAINPLGTSSQASTAGNQVSKTMHPQGTTASYGEPSHMPQSLGIMHTNTNVAHSHSSQQHQYSLNVLNTTGHYMNQNMGQIPASNHPVANPSSTAAGQGFSPQKNPNYMSNHEDIHQQNQNILPPVSQALPSSLSSQPSTNIAKRTSENTELQQPDKPQSNGTSELKSPQKIESSSSFTLISKEKSVQPAPVPQLFQVQEKSQEKTTVGLTSLPPEVTQLKPSETINVKAQTLPPTGTNSKSLPTVCSDTQHTETSSEERTTANSTSAAHEKNNEKPTSTTIDLSVKEPEHKKPKVEEKVTSAEQPENLKKNKSMESDKEVKIENNESPQTAELMETNEEKVIQKEKNTSVTLTETTPTKSSRKVKHQVHKTDESSRTPKETKISVQKSPSIGKTKRQRIRTQPYQSPLPEVELISKISSLTPRTPRSNDEKLIVFYKNEFLAVRNAEGSFYLCQTVQNIYKSSSKIKIRWLSQDKNDKSGEIYIPDFYDLTDFDCILTNLSLNRIDRRTFRLPPSEKERTQSILNRSLAAEKGEVTSPSLTEEHPDGLDLSLYRDEDQLKNRRAKKRKSGQKPSDLSSPIKKIPKAQKVRKVSSPAKTTAKNATVKKMVLPSKKSALQPESKKSASNSRRVSGRGKRKTENKTSPVVDQKKAKVLAKIGRNTAIPATKSIQSNTKNAKSGTKTAASSKKASQKKTNVSTSVKLPPRNARRSTRK